MTAVLPPPTTPAPGRVEVDSGDPCGAPQCGKPLDQHTGKPFHVDGTPVGNADCARALYDARHPRVKLCHCGALRGECDCPEVAAAAANAPTIRIRFGAR